MEEGLNVVLQLCAGLAQGAFSHVRPYFKHKTQQEKNLSLSDTLPRWDIPFQPISNWDFSRRNHRMLIMQQSRKQFTFIKEQFSSSLQDHSGMVPFPFLIV